ncbi:hypothetical protein ACA910_017345 [Epithemia clementina (nom. ined.)]
MRAKRLTLRVASEESFVFATQDNDEDGESEFGKVSEVADIRRSKPQKASFSRKIKDEENSEFSPSISVRMEEIGFCDFLCCGRSKFLYLEVDVVGSTRVLVVRDIPSDFGADDQLLNHLSALKAKLLEEEDRLEQLRVFQSQPSSPTDPEQSNGQDIISPAQTNDEGRARNQFSDEVLRNLVREYPEEKSITRVHQMIVEVIEATSLSSENFVEGCNPYVEVSLLASVGSSGGTVKLTPLSINLLPAVSDAPVRLEGKALDHVFESPSEIAQSIGKFYRIETFKQIYKIFGSLDFVGNPTILFTSFFPGLSDLILIPSQAFVKYRKPLSVGLGFAKGTLSLFSHSASGSFGYSSKIFAAAGQLLASLSFDRDFRAWHRENVLVDAANQQDLEEERHTRYTAYPSQAA